MQTTELRQALRSASSSQECPRRTKDVTGQWISIPGRQPPTRSPSPELSQELTALLERKASHDPKGGPNLPPLASKPAPIEQPHLAATTWTSGWRGGQVPRHKQRGRSSERSTRETGLPRQASGGQSSLMARRTFSLLNDTPERASTSSRATASVPEASPNQAAVSTPRRQTLTAWRPPRPPVASGRGTEASLPSALPGVRTPRPSTADARPISAGKRSRQLSIGREASTATSRPQSEDRGQSRCSDPGPVRSILRTSQSVERSHSQQQKRVSFSGDCKPARPSSIDDLVFGCGAEDASFELEESPGLTGTMPPRPGNPRFAQTPRARSFESA